MTHTSNTGREASSRNTAKAGARKDGGVPIEPHAELRDQQGRLLAGIVRREGEWVLGMGGQIAGSSDSAAHVWAMIRRAAVLHEAQGTPVRLTWSDALKDAAHAEAAGQGMTFEEFESRLEQSMSATKAQADDVP
jgi:hypothetical protein